MGNDELDDETDDLEFEKKMDELESGMKSERKTEKPGITVAKLNKDFLLNAIGVLYLIMIIFEWILVFIMTLFIFYPINYAMSPPGSYHIAGACFLILSFILNLQFQISKKSSDSGKFSFFLGLFGAILILIGAFQGLNYLGYLNYLAITVIIITVTLIILGCLQFSQLMYRKS